MTDSVLDHTYQAHIESHGLDEDTMTDTGYRIGELTTIGDACLSPGDPSPVGRTPDGDLAYPEHPTRTSWSLKRREAAWLAFLVARDRGILRIPEPPYHDPDLAFFMELVNLALPRVLFSDSAHDQIARTQGLDAILSGDMSKLPARICGKGAR